MHTLFKGIFIYSLGQFLSKIITFCLLPLLTKYLTAEDYGLIGASTLIAQCLTGFFGLGMSVVIGRYYWTASKLEEKHGIIWTVFTLLFIHASWIYLLCTFFKSFFTWMVFGVDHYTDIFLLTLLTTALGSVIMPFQLYFRLNEKAAFVVFCSLIEIAVSLTLSLFFVIQKGYGCYGLLLGGFLGQFASGSIYFISSCRLLHFSLQLKLVPKMVKMGYPYVLGLSGYFLLQGSSRYVLEWQKGLEVMGLFFLGSSFGRTLELLVSSFISAWVPYYSPFVTKQEEAKIEFGKAMSYYLLGISALLTLYFALAKPIVQLMVQPSYHHIWPVIGLIATAQALWGVYSLISPAFIFYQRSFSQMIIEISAGLSSFAFNAIFIYFYGIEGAALGMFFGFATLLLMAIPLNQRHLRIQFERERIVKIISGLIIVAVISFLPIASLISYTCMMVASSLSYYLFLWNFCVSEDEKTKLKGYLMQLYRNEFKSWKFDKKAP